MRLKKHEMRIPLLCAGEFFCVIVGNCVPYDTKASGGRRTPRRGIWLLTQPRSGASVHQAHTFLCVEIAFPMPQKPPAEGVFRLEEKGRLEKHVWGRFLKAQVSGGSGGRKEQTGSGRIVTAADLREGGRENAVYRRGRAAAWEWGETPVFGSFLQ